MNPEPYAENEGVSTHWDECWRFHSECHPRCQVCCQTVDRFELWEQPSDDGRLIRGHRTCLNDLVATGCGS